VSGTVLPEIRLGNLSKKYLELYKTKATMFVDELAAKVHDYARIRFGGGEHAVLYRKQEPCRSLIALIDGAVCWRRID
jgi:hypothetical protein